MHERFQRHVRLFVDRADFFDGEFASQNDAFDAEFRRDFDALGTGQRHLCRSVNWQIGAGCSNQSCEADVLHKDGVDSCFCQSANQWFDDFQLGRKRQSVQRYVALNASLVHKVHQLGQVVRIEIGGSRPSVESTVQAEVNRVGTVFNRRANAVPVAGGGEQFGAGRRAVCRFRSHSCSNSLMRMCRADGRFGESNEQGTVTPPC